MIRAEQLTFFPLSPNEMSRCEMLLDVCHHVGPALLVLLQPSEGRQVRAASRALNEWYQSHQRDFDMSFAMVINGLRL